MKRGRSTQYDTQRVKRLNGGAKGSTEDLRGTPMTKLKLFSLLAVSIMPVALSFPMLAQTASIHGHVNNAAGMTIPNAKIKLTTDKAASLKDQKFKYSFDVDANGDYKGADIAPADYLLVVISGEASVDFQSMVLKAGDDKVVNFDMTRKEYLDKMSAEEKTALEAYKKHAGDTMSANKMVANLNTALKSVREDLASANPNYEQNVQTMQQATTQKPEESVLWFTLGTAYIAQADAGVKKARVEKRSWQADETILKQYNDGIAADKKGIELNAASKKPTPADAGLAWNSIGTAEAKIGKLPEAQAAFENAVKLAPASAGMIYGNEAAVLFNNGQGDAAAAAAEKAIAADPTKADPYYVKGQALIAKATVDKTGKIVAPPGCAEAYQKYLELAPEGQHSQDAKEILVSMGEKINTKYKASGKK